MTSEKRVTLTSVYIADDHPVFRAGLTRLLEDAGLRIVGASGDGKTALKEIKQLKPDLAVLDVQMPELSGIRVLEALRLEGIAIQTVLISGFFNAEIVYEAITCGEASLVTKTSGFEEISRTVIAAACGETIISRELMSGLADEVRRRESRSANQPLSKRETEVVCLMARGKNRNEMALVLHVTPATVKYHIGNLYTKLAVSTASAAVAEAMRRGIFE